MIQNTSLNSSTSPTNASLPNANLAFNHHYSHLIIHPNASKKKSPPKQQINPPPNKKSNPRTLHRTLSSPPKIRSRPRAALIFALRLSRRGRARGGATDWDRGQASFCIYNADAPPPTPPRARPPFFALRRPLLLLLISRLAREQPRGRPEITRCAAAARNVRSSAISPAIAARPRANLHSDLLVKFPRFEGIRTDTCVMHVRTYCEGYFCVLSRAEIFRARSWGDFFWRFLLPVLLARLCARVCLSLQGGLGRWGSGWVVCFDYY